MKFVRNCDSGARLSKYKSMKRWLCEEFNVTLLLWFI